MLDKYVCVKWLFNVYYILYDLDPILALKTCTLKTILIEWIKFCTKIYALLNACWDFILKMSS